jgi:O-antigen/teichoic acid export membrane protein
MNQVSEDTTSIHQGNQFKKIIKHGSWYLGASLLTKATGLLLLPVYTRYLSPADYGLQSSLQSIQQLLPIFISLYVDSAFGRYYFLEKEVSPQKVKELYSTHFWFICLWGGSVVATGLVIAPYTFQPLLELTFLPYMPLTMIPALFIQLGALGRIFLRSNLKSKEYFLLESIVFLCSTSVILILLIPYEMGIQAKLYGMACGTFLSLGYFIFISRKYSLLGFHFKWSLLKRSLLYSLPLIPNIAAGWIAGFSDRLILSYYGKISEIGLYAVSAQLALVLYMINDAMMQVQGPISMSALTEDREVGKQQISKFLSVYVWTILLFYLVLTFFSKEILYVFTDERFHSAYRLVAILAFLYVMSGVYRIFTTIISFHEKTWIISSGAIFSAIVNMALNFSLIPYFGQWAAAWATFLSTMAYTIWIVSWAQKIYPVPINFRFVFSALFIVAVLTIIQQVVDYYNLIGILGAFILKSFLICFFILGVFVFPSHAMIRSNLSKLIRRFLVFSSQIFIKQSKL